MSANAAAAAGAGAGGESKYGSGTVAVCWVCNKDVALDVLRDDPTGGVSMEPANGCTCAKKHAIHYNCIPCRPCKEMKDVNENKRLKRDQNTEKLIALVHKVTGDLFHDVAPVTQAQMQDFLAKRPAFDTQEFPIDRTQVHTVRTWATHQSDQRRRLEAAAASAQAIADAVAEAAARQKSAAAAAAKRPSASWDVGAAADDDDDDDDGHRGYHDEDDG